MYACLVCGKYFQGRGRNTHAYTHSVQHGHHVFINLRTCRVYCLPDSYEVVDSSLEDIKRALDPRYSPEDIATLDKVRCAGGAHVCVCVLDLTRVRARDTQIQEGIL